MTTTSGIIRASVLTRVALLACVSGCGASTPQAAAPIAGMGPIPTNALVLVAPAALFEPPIEGGEPLSLDVPASAAPRVALMRVLADRGDWIDVESTIGHEPSVCASTRIGVADLPMHFVVHRADLALVTSREVARGFDDDTSLRLAPGVLLVPLPSLSRPDRAIYTAYVDGLILNTPIPRDAIADYFVPSDRPAAEAADAMLVPGADAVFGGRAHIGHYGRTAPRAYVYARREIPSGSIVEMRTPCAALTVRVNSQAIVASVPPVSDQGTEAATGAAHVRAGATIYWPNGAAAAHTTAEISVANVEATGGARRCFALAGALELRACADTADLLGLPSAPTPLPAADTDASAAPLDDASAPAAPQTAPAACGAANGERCVD